ncbi:MAG: arylsulfatase [Paludibacter sp.]|nr:arylsulfatase [Paludibacter sp.]
MLSTGFSQNPTPNVIFILTDDQGSGDLGCYGNKEIKTPNIDALAQNSIRFYNFHTGTTSAPTRAGLFTGRNCNSTGVWHTVQGRSYLAREEVTLAETFVNSGYSTGIFGKWHLGEAYPYRPQDRGFQETLIHGGGGVGQQPDYWGNTYFDDTYFRNGIPVKQTGYCTDVWFREAIKFIDNNKKNPFFCYISLNAPHSPFHVEEVYAAPYRNNPAVPNPEFYGMVTNIDENVGILKKYLKETGLDKNTIVVYMTDNGTAGGSTFDKDGFLINGFNRGMRGAKASPYEGGHRTPFILSVPGVKAREVNDLTSYIDFMPTLVDLCQLKMPRKVQFDGVSLRPLLKGGKLPSRTLVVDTQREEFLRKGKMYCVMSDHWRLVNGNELYNLDSDPEQRTNIAAQHPGVVAKLAVEYEKWWEKTSVRADEFQYINIGDLSTTTLLSHDLHNEENKLPAWNQEMVRRGIRSDGYWTVEVSKSGVYQFQLMRWPVESGLGLLASAPEGRSVPNGKAFSQGKPLEIKSAVMRIGSRELKSTISGNFEGASIDFTVKLEKGRYTLSAGFIDGTNSTFSPYYIVVNSTNLISE